jgi:hypothetical protein
VKPDTLCFLVYELVKNNANFSPSYISLPFVTFQVLEFLQPFLHKCFQSHVCECFNFSSCNFKRNMNKNGVKYLQNINFSQLTLAGNIEIKNSGLEHLILLFLSHQAEYKLM